MTVKIKRVRENARLPVRATKGSAGYDLFCCAAEPVTIASGAIVTIPTGIAVELPDNGYAAFIFGRSGLGVKHGIALANAVGVIDSDYRGELSVGLLNQSGTAYTVQPGDRIAQMVIMPVVTPELIETDTLGVTVRGENGFGSTNR